MDNVFQLIEIKDEHNTSEKHLSLGIQVRVGEHMGILPVMGECRSFGVFAKEVEALQRELEDSLEKARTLFEGRSGGHGMGITDDMAPKQVWTVLSGIAKEETFVESFNRMDEQKRREVAEYVLTSCNIFAGKAAVFSARYDSDSALLE